MDDYYTMIAIHNNSKELHDALERIGYKKLSWTTYTGVGNQITIKNLIN